MTLKRLLYFFSALIIGVFILIATLPTVLSNAWVQSHYLLPLLERSSKGNVTIGLANFSWFGTQQIQDFHWWDHQADIRMKSLSLDASLIRLLFTRSYIPEGKIDDLNIDLSDKVQLDGLSGKVTLEDGALQLVAHGTTTQNTQTGKIEIQGRLPFLKWNEEGVLTAELVNVPSRFFKMPVTSAHIPLYEFLGEDLNGTLTFSHGILNVKAATGHGSADFSVQFVDGGIRFPREGKITYQMPKGAAAKLNRAGLLAIQSPLVLHLLQGEQPQIQFRADTAKLHHEMTVNQVQGVFKMSPDLRKGWLKVNGMLHERSGETPLSAEGHIIFEPAMQWDLEITAKNLKTTVLQPFFHDPHQRIRRIATAALGSSIDGKLRLYQEDGRDYAQIKLDSERAHVPKTIFELNKDRVALADATNVEIHFSPNNIFRGDDGIVAYLPGTIPMTIQLNEFEMKLGPVIEPKDIHLNAHISTKEMAFSRLPLIGGGALTNGSVTIQGPTLAEIEASFHGRLNQLDETRYLSRLLNHEVRFSAQSSLTFNDQWDIAIQKFEASSDNPTLKFAFQGKQMRSNPYGLEISGGAKYTMLPVQFTEDPSTHHYHLIAPMNIDFALYHGEIDIRHPSWDKTSGQGKFVIDHIVAGETQSQAVASLKQVEIPWSFHQKSKKLAFNFDAESLNPESVADGRFRGEVIIDNFMTKNGVDLTKWRVDAEANLEEFPVAILEALARQDGLDELLGPTLSANLSVHDDEGGEQGHVTFHVSGDRLSAQGALSAKDSLMLADPEQPITFEWVMTPERYTHFRRFILKQSPAAPEALSLSQSATFSAKITELAIPLDQPARAKAAVKISSSQVFIRDSATEDLVSLQEMSAEATTGNLARELNLNLQATGHIYNRENETFQLYLQSALQNVIHPQIGWNLSHATAKVSGGAKQAPVVLIANLAALDPAIVKQIDALLGHRLDGTFQFTLKDKSGPIAMSIAGTKGKVSLDGQLAGGILTLNSPLAAEIMVSPELTDSILDEIVPFLNSAVSSDTLVNMAISPNGFQYPLWSNANVPFSIGSMRIDLGRITFRNNHSIAQILHLLKYPSGSELVTVWFTPLYLSYDSGIVTLKRMDMLVADQYPIAVWGKVNFVEDKMSLKIGLGGITLKRAFGLKGVPKNYYLQVPLKGSPKDPNLDIAGASTKIGALMAQLRGGPQGIIVGGLMDIIGTTLGQKPTPPPTTTPFPWEIAN